MYNCTHFYTFISIHDDFVIIKIRGLIKIFESQEKHLLQTRSLVQTDIQ